MKTKQIAFLGAALCIMASAPVLAQDGMAGEGRGQFFKNMDTNGDGFISKDEYMAAAEARFKKLDANGDGKISKEEMKQAYQGRRKKQM
jgi:hypothetical protein